MRLSDVMGHLDLSVYAEMGLVLFIAVFVGSIVMVMTSKRSFNEKMSAMPLEDDDMGVAVPQEVQRGNGGSR